jgi:hypothetical protein
MTGCRRGPETPDPGGDDRSEFDATRHATGDDSIAARAFERTLEAVLGRHAANDSAIPQTLLNHIFSYILGAENVTKAPGG